MRRPPPESTRTGILIPYTTRFRSAAFGVGRVKAFAVARHQRLDHRRFRLVGLKHHAAGLLAPARPSGDLLYLLKGPFAGPQVAPAEAEVGIHHTAQRQGGKAIALLHTL